jgi:hypothetical protein
MSAITTLAGQSGWTHHAINRDGTAALCRANLKPRTFPNYDADGKIEGHWVALHEVPGDPFERSCDRNRVNCLACARKLAKILDAAYPVAYHMYGDVLNREALASRAARKAEGSEVAAPAYRIVNRLTGTAYLVLGTGPAENAPHLTAVWVQKEGEQGASPWSPAEMISSWWPLVATCDHGYAQHDSCPNCDIADGERPADPAALVSLPARESGTHGDRYALVHGTFSMGGGYLISDRGTENGDYLKAPDGKDWRTTSRTLADQAVNVLNRADRVGAPFVLPELEGSVSVNRPGLNPLAGPKRSTTGARTVVIPQASDRDPVRAYRIRYALVTEVDGRGSPCEYCSLKPVMPVECNIYATSLDGGDEYAQSCLSCALPVVDQVLDTDPAHVVTIERLV